MALEQVEVLMRNGYDIGIGVASATGSPMAKGATGDVTKPQVGGGGSGSFVFRRIESNEELATSLGIDADVAGGVGLFRASNEFSLQKEMRVQSSSLTVLVKAEVRMAFQQMDEPALTEAAGKLKGNGKEQQFADQFGEYFVRGINSGGRFVGVVRIDTKSSQAKTDLDNELKGMYGAVISADVRVKIAEAMKRAEAFIEVKIIFDGGEVKTHPTSDNPVELLGQLYKAMDEWSNTVRKDPKAYTVTLAPYIIALGPRPPNLAEFEHQRDVLIRCAKLRLHTMDKLNLIDYMLSPRHRDEFEAVPGGPDLPDLQARLAGDLDVIADAASFAIDNIKEACDPETFMRTIKQVPDFKLTPLPPNLPKHTGGKPALPNIRVPNMVGMNFGPLGEALRCLHSQGVTIDECFNGTDAQGVGPIHVNKDIAELMWRAIRGGPKIIWLPADPFILSISDTFADRNWDVAAQQPPAGTLVKSDEEVVIQFVDRPF